MDTSEVVPTAPNTADESTSLSDHEQSFHAPPSPRVKAGEAVPGADDDDAPAPAADGRDDKGRWKARSQRATPADVETINQLTKELREIEDELGVKIERKQGESDRVYNLRKRVELAKIAKGQAKQPEKAAAPVLPPAPTREAPKPFEEKEPQYDDFASEPDQYLAYTRALAAYDRRKDEAARESKSYETENFAAIKARNEAREKWFGEREHEHYTRLEAYVKANPHAQAIIDQAGDVKLTPAMYAAIITADNSPELLVRVAQDVNLRDDLIDLTEGKPLNRDLVERVQRRLNRGSQSVKTGADAPPPPKPIPAVPRPPTPVRTGPMKTGETLPDDDSSLSAHESAFHRRRRS